MGRIGGAVSGSTAGMHPTYMLPVVVRVLVVLPAKTLEVLQGLRWRCEGWRVGWGRKGSLDDSQQQLPRLAIYLPILLGVVRPLHRGAPRHPLCPARLRGRSRHGVGITRLGNIVQSISTC